MEQFLAYEGGVVHARAGGAEFVVGDYLQDCCGVQFSYSTFIGEGKMVVFKAFDGAGWAGESGPLRVWVGRNSARTAGRVGRRFISYDIHSHVQGREVDVKEGRVVPVLTFHSVHKLGDELERGWGTNIVRVNFPGGAEV